MQELDRAIFAAYVLIHNTLNEWKIDYPSFYTIKQTCLYCSTFNVYLLIISIKLFYKVCLKIICCRMCFLYLCMSILPIFRFLCLYSMLLNLLRMRSCLREGCFLFLSLLSSSNPRKCCSGDCFYTELGMLLRFLFLGRFAAVGRMGLWGLMLSPRELMVLELQCLCFDLLSDQ